MNLEALIVAGAYLVGAIPFGLIFARLLTGKDPRRHGSGNIGATNAMRTGGKAVGILTLAADIAKGALPVYLAITLGAGEIIIGATAIAAFLGHIFPVYLGFKGGKGVATMFGVMIPWLPWVALIAFGVWLAVVMISRYVSVASIAAGISLPVAALFFGASMSGITVCVLLGLIMTVRHHSNIARLAAGEESKIGSGRDKQ